MGRDPSPRPCPEGEGAATPFTALSPSGESWGDGARRKHARRAVVLLLLAAPIAAAAQNKSGDAGGPPPQTGWAETTSRQLSAQCHAADKADHGRCLGYIAGIYDLQFAPTPPAGICPPKNLDPENLAAVVTAYSDTHDDGPAPGAIQQAIVRFFPCPPKEGRR